MSENLEQLVLDLVKRNEWDEIPRLLRKHSALRPLDFPYNIGEKILIRGARYYYCGKITNITPKWVTLDKNSAWVADTGRFNEVLLNGFSDDSETEVYPDEVHVPIDTILDMTLWRHDVK